MENRFIDPKNSLFYFTMDLCIKGKSSTHTCISGIQPIIQEAVSLFGVDRCMVGSNCPSDAVYLFFDEIFALMKRALADYPERDQQKIFYGNAKRIYRL
jgi:predicted TIM-barrel fold metal-dependent hydrolase